MTFVELADILKSTVQADWHLMAGRPTYWYNLQACEAGGNGGTQRYVDIDSHLASAVYKHDLSITMAWGMGVNDNFIEPWANQFSDPKATSYFVDVFYNGAIVLRQLNISVDGGRADLPMPVSASDLRVASGAANIARIVTDLAINTNWDNYFERAGLVIDDAVQWS